MRNAHEGWQNARITTASGGMQFDEVLRGHLHRADGTTDFETAESTAKQLFSAAELSLTVEAHWADHGSYVGMCCGTLFCPTLSPGPLIAKHGRVSFFTPDPDVSDATNMVYRMDLESLTGKHFRFHGFKRLDSAAALSIPETWRAMTTLYTTITSFDGVIVAKGILHLTLRGFISEMASLRSHRLGTALDSMRTQVHFLNFFASNVASYTFSIFRSLQYPSSFEDTTGHFIKPVPSTTTLIASDGTKIPMMIWEPTPHTPARDTSILFVPGAGVTENIFALPTVQINVIDHFTSRGYRCYLVLPRFSSTNAARKGDTVYDARLDVRAALEHVREREDGRKPYVVVHCLGSIAMGIGLLTGDVPAHWMRGMTTSQVFVNLHFSWDNALKGRSEFLLKTYQVCLMNLVRCKE